MSIAKTLATVLFCLAATNAPAADLLVDSGGTDLDYAHLAEASRATYHGRYSEALGRVDAVLAKSPNFAGAFMIRARYYIDVGRYAEALADLDHVAQFHPDAASVPFTRALIFIRQRNGKQAQDALIQAAKMPQDSRWKGSYEGSSNAPGSSLYHYVSQHTISYSLVTDSLAEELLGHDDAALDSLDSAVNREHGFSEHILAAHCYEAAVAGLLEMAELTCTQAIARQTYDFGAYDSLGFVHLKMKKWDAALADYNKSLALRSDLTMSLYGRGVAKHAKGDLAGGDADIAAAKKGEPDIVNIMARLGVTAS